MIYIFTHTDLDGVISGLFLKHYFDNLHNDTTVMYCSAGKYGNLSSSIEKVLATQNDISRIFVTDLSPDDQTMEHLAKLDIPVKVIDHHESNLYMAQQYPDLIINRPLVRGKQTCAAILVYNYLFILSESYRDGILPYRLADITRSYDTWDWQIDPHDTYGTQARDFDGLLYLYGKEIFIQHTLKALANGELINDEDQHIMDLQQQRNDTYIKMKVAEVNYTTLQLPNGHVVHAGIVGANRLFSELGNAILLTTDPNTNEKCHLSIMVSNSNVSLRSDDEIDCSQIATMIDGGGHPKASGAKIDFDPAQALQKAFDQKVSK